jgi:hypothetical protein
MHDPMTVAHEIRYPWRKYGRKGRNDFERNYRECFITIWHVDPETDGSDDSCGWFQRANHGSPAVYAAIKKRFAEDWDRVFTSDESGQSYFRGYFKPSGEPHLSPMGITLNLFFLAAYQHFGQSRERADKFMQRNLFDILRFAENPTDSLVDSITMKFGYEAKRQDRIDRFASIVYGYILRATRPWYRHPRWHVWHWQIQIHPWQQVRRWLLTRCTACGKRFRYGESPVRHSWDSDRPRFLRGERGLYHGPCSADAMKPSP